MAEITTGQRNEVRPIMPVGWRLWLWWVRASSVGGAVLGAVYGVITGAALVWLLHQRAVRTDDATVPPATTD